MSAYALAAPPLQRYEFVVPCPLCWWHAIRPDVWRFGMQCGRGGACRLSARVLQTPAMRASLWHTLGSVWVEGLRVESG